MSLSQIIARSVDLLPWWLRTRIRKIPIIAAVQRFIFKHTFRNSEFNHRISAGPAKGLLFPVHLPDDKLYWSGTWEEDITQAIALRVNSAMTCYDIGSHRGFMAGVMGQNGAGTIWCFEPNPVNTSNINTLIALNPELDLRLLEMAVGSSEGRAQFSIMPEDSMGKLSQSSFQREADMQQHIDVELRTLDGLLADGTIEPAKFVKIDIEGAEFEALKGAKKLIANSHPEFLIEAHAFDLLVSCREYLEGYGYSCRVIQQEIDTITAQNFRVCHLLAIAN